MATNTKVVIAGVVVLILVVASAVLLFYESPKTNPGTTTSVGSNGDKLTIVTNNLTVGYQSGLWTIRIQNSAPTGLTELTVVLHTPIETMMCSGQVASSLAFGNCPATPITAVAPGATITGYATGAGPGSAIPGSSYNFTITAGFEDGSSYVFNSSVVAQSHA